MRHLPRSASCHKFLMERETCSYGNFQELHRAFLHKHPDADERQRRRRLQFIEEPGLESALWPVLFYDNDLCLTHVRATDIRRLARLDESDTEDEEEVDASRHSTKKAYAALALCSRIGYGCSYELLHFAWDFNLWSALGAKKSTSVHYGVPMRVLVKGQSFSPLYWLSVHWALIDMVRQLGYPKIFWTLSPYEWSMPYHEWVRDEMAKCLRRRLRLPVAETLHLTHVLFQTVKGLLIGSTGKKQTDPWQRHICKALDEDGRPSTVHAFCRLEFQDGTHKAPTQDYHGSGRPHMHVLVFCTTEALRNMDLDETVSATMPQTPDENDLFRGVVSGSQLDRKGRSGWPVHDGCSEWDEDRETWTLSHSKEDKSNGLRPYFVDIMETLRCHQDFQLANDDGLLRAYVTKYVSKFSDANQQEWLNDAAEGNAIAATVLCRYKPMEPEMVLQLFGASMRQWFVTTLSRGKRDFVVPWPRKPNPPEVDLYMAADWARGKISLLSFLRKTNKAGKICAWMKKLRHEEGRDHVSLEDFAVEYNMQAEKIVAAQTLSRFNDKFFGQWLMLNVPFEKPADFYEPLADQLKLVPKEHENYAMALLSDHPLAVAMWHSDAAIQADMKLEAMSRPHSETVMGMVKSTRVLIHRYLDGELDLKTEEAERAARKEAASRAGGAGHVDMEFNAEQERFRDMVMSAVERSLSARWASEEEADAILDEVFKHKKIFVCHGGPGTGKTTVARACVDRTLGLEGRVLFSYPTNRQASRMRAKLPEEVDVDTFHASFGLDEEPGTCAAAIAQYDLIVADEFSLMQARHFEHIIKLWAAADYLPALILLGDELQMGGFGEERPWHSKFWSRYTFRTRLHRVYRCKDEAFNRILQELRTSRPRADTLRWLQKRKAWAPPMAPTVEGMQKLLKAHPDTTILTVSRLAMQTINDLALKALFPVFPPLATVEGDLEANPDNYVEGKLKEAFLLPLKVPIFKGMRIVLTKTLRKDVDFVNGMDGIVKDFHHKTNSIQMETTTGYKIMVWPYTDPDFQITFLPVRPGYADTIVKFQGAELPHVTVYLDKPGIPGAAYTALSRVSYGKDVLLGGVLTAEHFQPVDES